MNIFKLAHEVSILDVWVRLALDPMKKLGSNWVSTDCPNCGHKRKGNGHKVSANIGKNIFHCFSCGTAGDSINAVMAQFGLTSLEAAEWLTGKNRDEPSFNDNWKAKERERKRKREREDEQVKAREREVTKALTMLVNESPHCPVAWKYMKRRGISETTLRQGYGNQFFGTSNTPKETMIEVAKGLAITPDKVSSTLKWLKERSLVFPYKDKYGKISSCEFRKVKKESYGPKSIRFGKIHNPNIIKGEVGEILICEGMIDALSVKDLGYSGNIMSIPGVCSLKPEWVRGYNRVRVGLDNDKAGHIASLKLLLGAKLKGDKVRKMLKEIPHSNSWEDVISGFNQEQQNWLNKHRILSKGNDWNEDLMNQ